MAAEEVEAMQSRSEAIPTSEPWARVLAGHQEAGGLDYAALAANPEDLEIYLRGLAEARPEDASREERIAFWSNVYNAVTAKFVLDHYPELTSVKEVEGFFRGKTFLVAGAELTLDEIEKRALEEGDPRVHFAVVCASTSCPDLRKEPYRGDRLEEQLADQTRTFLLDETKGLRFDGQQLFLSSLFKWYAGDFTGGSTVVAYFSRGRLLDWILPHLRKSLAEEIKTSNPQIKYLDYDWSLNDR